MESKITEYTGAEFNAKYAGDCRFYKFTKQSNIQNKLQLVSGLNVDPNEFNCEQECSAGGIYFTYNEMYHTWITPKSHVWVWDVVIPDDARVAVECHNKAKASAVVLQNQRSILDWFSNMNYNIQKQILQSNRELVQYMKHVDEKTQLFLMTVQPSIFRCIRNPTQKTIEKAVSRSRHNIQFVKNPSEEIQFLAVKFSSMSIVYIENPSVSIQHQAVLNDPFTIRFIKNPHPDIQLTAVKSNPECVEFIKGEVSESVKEYLKNKTDI